VLSIYLLLSKSAEFQSTPCSPISRAKLADVNDFAIGPIKNRASVIIFKPALTDHRGSGSAARSVSDRDADF
jgi:hypothetical protein